MPISRLWISAVLSLSFVIGSVSHAQDIPRREAADKLLRDAITRQNLQGPQNPPIQFRARIHFEYRGSTAEGTYDLLWDKADRFRDTLQLGDATETDVVLGNKIYISRSTPTLLPHFDFLKSMLRFPFFRYAIGLQQATVTKVYRNPVAATPSFCYDVGDLRENRYCFDTASHLMISLHSRWLEPDSSASFDEAEFLSAGNIRYPGHFSWSVKGESLEVHVEKLEVVTLRADDTFLPPYNVLARDWCLHPHSKPPFNKALPFPKTHPPDTFFPFYVLIRPDGHIEKFVSLNPTAPPVDAAVENWIHKVEYPIVYCGDKPIGTEEIIKSR